MSFQEAYAPDRIGRPWGFRSSDYAGGSHRGQDVRKVHESGDYSVETDVVAISDGVVDYVGRPNGSLGPTVRIRRDKGGYEFHSHTVASVSVGTRTTDGTRLGRNARMSEAPGLIRGVHDHIVFSDYSDGAWNTNRPTHDPMRFITEKLTAVAAEQSRPFVPPIPLKDHTMRTVRWNKTHCFTFGEQQVTHYDNQKHADAARIIHNPDGQFIELDDLGLTVSLLSFGVPWSAVDACMRGWAYDITGAVGGRFWARSIEQKIDTSRLAQSIEDLRRAAADLPGPSKVS